jgi:hypothetical protein
VGSTPSRAAKKWKLFWFPRIYRLRIRLSYTIMKKTLRSLSSLSLSSLESERAYLVFKKDVAM